VKAVAHRLALEGVEVETADVRVLGPDGLMKSAKPALCSILQLSGHLAAAAGIPKIGETLVAEALDHGRVKHGLSQYVKSGFTDAANSGAERAESSHFVLDTIERNSQNSSSSRIAPARPKPRRVF
jgi:hypothetical protein